MQIRQLFYTAGLTAAVASVLAPVPAAHAATRLSVRPGESVQAAVDRAGPGDTVLLAPGTYRESVQLTTSGVTLRGAGARTVLSPPEGAPRGACAVAGHGVCVTGTAQRPVTDVRIRSLTVSGFPHNGVWGTDTDRMDVRGVLAEHNGEQGLGQQRSTRGVFAGNTARDNGEAGIFLANIVGSEGGAPDSGGSVVAANHLTGNRFGVVIRRLRNLAVADNDISANCGGVFIVGDESTPRAGALSVTDNRVTANNKRCAATTRLPVIQGTGIVLTGAEDVRVTDNEVRDNAGASPMSGGIVLFRSMTGAPNARHTISDNQLSGNLPADLADRDTATGAAFTGNTCAVSEPAGRCAGTAQEAS